MLGSSFVAKFQASILAEPRQRALHHETSSTESASMNLAIHLGNQRLDAPISNAVEDGGDSVGAISLKDLRPESREACDSLNQRNRVEKIQGGHFITDVGWSGGNNEGNPAGFCDQMAFAASLGSICWVRACVDPPKTARTEALSMIARDQSICPSLARWLSSRRCSSGQTPNTVHSSSRRQHVGPLPQPNCAGSASQGIPVFNTNTMPERQLRSGTRGRPPLGLGIFFGRRSDTSFQSSSVTKGKDMSTPSLWSTHRHFALVT